MHRRHLHQLCVELNESASRGGNGFDLNVSSQFVRTLNKF
jgi:hypothetical protein